MGYVYNKGKYCDVFKIRACPTVLLETGWPTLMNAMAKATGTMAKKVQSQ